MLCKHAFETAALMDMSAIFDEESTQFEAFFSVVLTINYIFTITSFLPLGSTSFKTFLTSASVGFNPRDRRISPSWAESTFPSPLLSKSKKASLCSGDDREKIYRVVEPFYGKIDTKGKRDDWKTMKLHITSLLPAIWSSDKLPCKSKM